MRIHLTIDQPTDDFQTDLLALLAKYAAQVEIDRTWTLPRAEAYFRSLPARARRIIAEVVAGDGYVSADDLRDNPDASLRGHAGPLARALQRGVANGSWPEGMQPPIEAQGPGFGKVVGYRMPDDLVEVFYTAVRRTKESGPIDPKDLKRAVDGVHELADTLHTTAPKRKSTTTQPTAEN